MSPRSLSRLVPAGLLGLAAALTGGLSGVLLGFFAALLIIDRVLDRVMGPAGAGSLEADHAFRRLAHERRRAARRGGSELVFLPEDAGWVAVAQRLRLGVQTVAIGSIVGSVDRHKAASFDRAFRPPDWSRGRWTLMYRAARRGAPMPPVSLYRVGDGHYVRDGHHRVSVARAIGAQAIDAEVVELRAPHSGSGSSITLARTRAT
jgi:hypothetical protein